MSKIFLFPGQGSQEKGMGAGLFEEFPEETAAADRLLGYSIQELCLEDPDRFLAQTQFTQPALYVVNGLTYMKRVKETGEAPDFVAGHSLGEYNALLAAGVFDFRTGLQLVQKRGELMSQATGGGMAAVVGLTAERIRGVLDQASFSSVDVANLNTPDQTVISGQERDIQAVKSVFEEAGARRFIPLKVSGAFHSRYMETARAAFERFLADFDFPLPQIPVISNLHARPYLPNQTQGNLCGQITHPVRWTESIQYLLQQPDPIFEELGPGKVLTRLTRKIQAPASSRRN